MPYFNQIWLANLHKFNWPELNNGVSDCCNIDCPQINMVLGYKFIPSFENEITLCHQELH